MGQNYDGKECHHSSVFPSETERANAHFANESVLLGRLLSGRDVDRSLAGSFWSEAGTSLNIVVEVVASIRIAAISLARHSSSTPRLLRTSLAWVAIDITAVSIAENWRRSNSTVLSVD